MIDYSQLSADFSSKLREFHQCDLLDWLTFDRNRELIELLLAGKIVSVKYETATPIRLMDWIECVESGYSDTLYEMAA